MEYLGTKCECTSCRELSLSAKGTHMHRDPATIFPNELWFWDGRTNDSELFARPSLDVGAFADVLVPSVHVPQDLRELSVPGLLGFSKQLKKQRLE